MESDRKVCYICHSSRPEEAVAWVRPCLCRGAEVHQLCLLTVIQRTMEDAGRIYCARCGVNFKVLPEKGLLDRFMGVIDRGYDAFCKIVLKVIAVAVMDVGLTTIGLLVLYQVYGQSTRELVLAMEPMSAVSLCQNISLGCVLAHSLPWEDRLLRLLRRCSSIPIVGRILPLQDTSIKLPPVKHSFNINILIGGILLPIYAHVIGDFMFSTESPVKRFILGGAVFILVKGFLTTYYKQKNYVRRSQMTIANYAGRSDE